MRFLILFLPLLLSCAKEEGVFENETMSLLDCTDSSLGKLSFTQMTPLVNITNNDNGATFRMKYISDTDFGRNACVQLLPRDLNQDETEEERYYMKKQFLTKAETTYSKFLVNVKAKPHSIIYRTIANELNSLSKSKAQNRSLVTNSDLMENSDVISFYDVSDARLLETDADSVKRVFLKSLPIQRLDGVTVYFTYVPKDFEANKMYSKIHKIYVEIITQAGGICLTSLPSS